MSAPTGDTDIARAEPAPTATTATRTGRTPAPHGTHARYRLDRCRCYACAFATSRYDERRRKLMAQGRWEPFVPAEPVRLHVRALGAQGMGWKRAARAAGLSPSTVWKLLYGVPSAGRPPCRRIRRATAEALLGVTVDLAGGANVDASATWRRVHALMAHGYSKAWVSRQIGQGGRALQIGEERVLKATADTLRAVYEATEMTPGTDSRARNHARRMGWPGPEHWYDIEAGVSYADAAGEVDDEDDLDFMLATGASLAEAASRLGTTEGRLRARLAKRAERAA